MGRLKTYDREEVTKIAMQSFWKSGYNAISTKQLANDMGVNVYSLFAEFDSKQGLFEAALMAYGRDVITAMFEVLDKPDAGLIELKLIITQQSENISRSSAVKGCLYCNTAVERGSDDPASRIIYGAHVERVRKLVERALQNAVRAGDLPPETSCRDQAAMIITTFQGISVLVRARVDPEVVLGSVRAVLNNLELLAAYRR